MEYLDQLKVQIERYRRLVENASLDSRAVTRIKVSIAELEEQLRAERVAGALDLLQAG